jgi:ParB/RepB/Spo0J family partition protein
MAKTARKTAEVDEISSEDSIDNYAPSAMTHEFIADFDLSRINPNPYNVREDAIADDELVESVRESGLIEPIIVAPALVDEGRKAGAKGDHDLVAGHRRLNALDRIGATTAPVIIRYDLDTRAKQVEAMIIENDRRQGLTPMEQAKGYKQLTLFGATQSAVAKRVGVAPKTVSERLKLLNLNTAVQQRVNEGQVTIDDAIAVAALPPAEQTKVAKTAGTYSFKYDLEAAQRRVKKQAEIDAKIVDLKAAGIPERTFPAGKTVWNITDADDGMVRLGATFSHSLDDHAGCLAWVKVTGPDLEYVCTNVSAHDEQLEASQLAAREEAERATAERRAQEEAEDIARRLRMDAVLDAIRGAKLAPALERVLRLAHRGGLFELGWHTTEYFEVLQIPDDQQWDRYPSQWKPEDVTNFQRHIDSLVKPAALLRAVTALVIAQSEGKYFPYLGDKGPRSPHAEQASVLAGDYLDVARAAGHELTPVELDLLNPSDGEDEQS